MEASREGFTPKIARIARTTISPHIIDLPLNVQGLVFRCLRLCDLVLLRHACLLWRDNCLAETVHVTVIASRRPEPRNLCDIISKFHSRSPLDGRILSKLKFLDLRCVSACVNDLVLEAVGDYCRGLRTLLLHGSRCVQVFGRKVDAVTDVGITSVARKCNKLKELEISGCFAVTDLSVKELANNCPDLESLNISWCSQISCDGIKALKKLKHLRELKVVHCNSFNGVTSSLKTLRSKNELRLTGGLDLRESDSVLDAQIRSLQKCNIVFNTNFSDWKMGFSEYQWNLLTRKFNEVRYVTFAAIYVPYNGVPRVLRKDSLEPIYVELFTDNGTFNLKVDCATDEKRDTFKKCLQETDDILGFIRKFVKWESWTWVDVFKGNRHMCMPAFRSCQKPCHLDSRLRQSMMQAIEIALQSNNRNISS